MRLIYNSDQIQRTVRAIAKIIHDKHHNDPNPPVMICLLNGAFMFFTDLVKAVEIDCEIDFIRVKSYYGNDQGEVQMLRGWERSLRDKDVYIVDDICDTGNTLKKVVEFINIQTPKSITPVTLFKRSTTEFENLIYGFELTDEIWLYGYGLDASNGLMRNRTSIFGDTQEID